MVEEGRWRRRRRAAAFIVALSIVGGSLALALGKVLVAKK
jgi:hypothetical protein